MPLPEIDPAKREKQLSTLRAQSRRILKRARERGLETNYFFINTFSTYQTQLALLQDLEDAIREMGLTVTKEYVKGRENVVVNPAVTEFVRVSSAANNTVSCLINILKAFENEQTDTAPSKLDRLRASLEKQPDR